MVAWDEIRKDIDIGEFLFSAASIQVLQTLMRETDSIPDDPAFDYVSHLEKLQAGVEKCLPAIKAAARADLELPPIRRRLSAWKSK